MKKFLFTFLILLAFNNSYSQKTIQGQKIWFGYSGQYKVTKHWGYLMDVQFRMENNLQQNYQNVFRFGGTYFLSDSKNFTVGYSFFNTYNPKMDDFFIENRIWEQFQYTSKWKDSKSIMIHRFRLEQRWVEKLGLVDGDVVKAGTLYQNRFRYCSRNLFHLANIKSAVSEIYAVVQDEIYVPFGGNSQKSNLIDQNRFFAGLGLNHNNNIRFEIGYLNQYTISPSTSNLMNHIVSFSLLHNLDLYKSH